MKFKVMAMLGCVVLVEMLSPQAFSAESHSKTKNHKKEGLPSSKLGGLSIVATPEEQPKNAPQQAGERNGFISPAQKEGQLSTSSQPAPVLAVPPRPQAIRSFKGENMSRVADLIRQSSGSGFSAIINARPPAPAASKEIRLGPGQRLGNTTGPVSGLTK